jgi:hypothetical protein
MKKLQCPHCSRKFNYWYSFKILNPYRHACPDCRTTLTLNRFGIVGIGVSGFLGLLFGLLHLEIAHYLDTPLWAVWCLFLLLVIIFSVLWWQSCEFEIKQEKTRPQQSRVD